MMAGPHLKHLISTGSQLGRPHSGDRLLSRIAKLGHDPSLPVHLGQPAGGGGTFERDVTGRRHFLFSSQVTYNERK